MHLNSNVGDSGYHIWRQRIKGGEAEQLTFGPTEQEGIAMAPDGRSLVSSVGLIQSSIWLRGPDGERQITSEGSALRPTFSRDGTKLYCLSGKTVSTFASGELWEVDLASGRQLQLIPGIRMTAYDVSADDQRAVFAAPDPSGHSRLWIAPLDQRTAPRELPGVDLVQPRFTADGGLVFVAVEGNLNYLVRSKPDGSAWQKVNADPVLELIRLSPDGQWALVWAPVRDVGSPVRDSAVQDSPATGALMAWPMAGGTPRRICGACSMNWPPDEEFVYLVSGSNTYRVPLSAGRALPTLPAAGIQSEADLQAIPGAKLFLPSGTASMERLDLRRERSLGGLIIPVQILPPMLLCERRCIATCTGFRSRSAEISSPSIRCGWHGLAGIDAGSDRTLRSPIP
ncbi:hypothetical protein SBA4_1240010 [Candidatus Sulfopaludibacter sp. SbA4]|nr:hypothetical protein SBA4_1240010 [Candidatus Sulfopaludibacter sp. SbA4]